MHPAVGAFKQQVESFFWSGDLESGCGVRCLDTPERRKTWQRDGGPKANQAMLPLPRIAAFPIPNPAPRPNQTKPDQTGLNQTQEVEGEVSRSEPWPQKPAAWVSAAPRRATFLRSSSVVSLPSARLARSDRLTLRVRRADWPASAAPATATVTHSRSLGWRRFLAKLSCWQSFRPGTRLGFVWQQFANRNDVKI